MGLDKSEFENILNEICPNSIDKKRDIGQNTVEQYRKIIFEYKSLFADYLGIPFPQMLEFNYFRL